MNPLSVGTNVKITVSDPWDFVTKYGSFFSGNITKIDPATQRHSTRLFISLDKPLIVESISLGIVSAGARHANDALANMPLGKEVAANFSFLIDSDDVRKKLTEQLNFMGSMKIESK